MKQKGAVLPVELSIKLAANILNWARKARGNLPDTSHWLIPLSWLFVCCALSFFYFGSSLLVCRDRERYFQTRRRKKIASHKDLLREDAD